MKFDWLGVCCLHELGNREDPCQGRVSEPPVIENPCVCSEPWSINRSVFILITAGVLPMRQSSAVPIYSETSDQAPPSSIQSSPRSREQSKWFPDWLLLPALLLTAVIYRTFTARFIEDGGDALGHWSRHTMISFWDYFNLTSYNHHLARFGVNIPVMLTQEFFGDDIVKYYIVPFTMASLQILFIYLICRRERSWLLTCSACLLCILHPLMTRNGSQILPGVFSGVYMMGCLYALSIFSEKNQHRGWLALGGLFLFLAWGAKVTNLLFVPGVLLGTLLIRRSLIDSLTVAAAWVFGLFIEWAFYAIHIGLPYGRYHALSRSASQNPTYETTFLGLFDRYSIRELSEAVAYPMYTAVALALMYMFLERRKFGIRALTGAFFISFVLFMALAVKSIDPLLPIQKYHNRYLTAGIPFTCLLLAFALFDLSRLWQVIHKPKWLRGTVHAFLTLACIGLAGFTLNTFHTVNSKYKTYGSYYETGRFPMADAVRFQAIADKIEESGKAVILDDYKTCFIYTRLFALQYGPSCLIIRRLPKGQALVLTPATGGLGVIDMERFTKEAKVSEITIPSGWNDLDTEAMVTENADKENLIREDLNTEEIFYSRRRPFRLDMAQIEDPSIIQPLDPTLLKGTP